jgi:hypothetical protein
MINAILALIAIAILAIIGMFGIDCSIFTQLGVRSIVALALSLYFGVLSSTHVL